MTVEWYDLAQRITAARAETVVERLCHAPVTGVLRPVAVRAGVRAGRVQVTACRSGEPVQTGEGTEGLRVLAEAGVQVGQERWATLVTDSPGTLDALLTLARATGHDSPWSGVAAHVGWWADRADFPGTSAVVDVTDACQARWVTGEAPEADRLAETWRRWLGVTDPGCGGLLDLLDQVTCGSPLPGLDPVIVDDQWSWQRACADHADGWDWRVPDSTGRAATGLRARCDTADLWEAALLEDSLYRRRAIHTGHVVSGVIGTLPATRNKVVVTCDRMDARLRVGAAVTGWIGNPDGAQHHRFSSTVVETGMRQGRLALFLIGTPGTTVPHAGSRVTLMDSPPNPFAKRRGQTLYRRLYGSRSSWLTTGRTPVPQRREVPLDVLIAGADDG